MKSGLEGGTEKQAKQTCIETEQPEGDDPDHYMECFVLRPYTLP